MIKSVLLISLLAFFSSCNWHNRVENKKKEINQILIGKVVDKLDDKIWKIYQDKQNNYWFGSNGKGIYHYDGKTLKQITTKDGLIDNSIRGIHEDNLGIIFIETPTGVSKFDGKTLTTLNPIISTDNQWRLEANDLWFNCNGNNLYRYDGKNLYELQLPRIDFGPKIDGITFEEINYSDYAVYGINKDKIGNLWLGTLAAGAFRYDGKAFLWIAEKELSTLPDGRVPGVRSIIEDIDGNFWLSNFISKYRISYKDFGAVYEKLEAVDMLKGQFQNRLPYFNSGLADSKKNLWMTTYGDGVWKYDGKTLLNFPIKKGQTHVLLISIYSDNQGTLWLGTDNDGVYKFDGNTFEKFDPK